jgi:sortase A
VSAEPTGEQSAAGPVDVDLREPSQPAGRAGVGLLDRAESDSPTLEVPVVERRRRWHPRRPTVQPGVRGKVGLGLLSICAALLGFVLFVYFFSSFPEARAQAGLQRAFKYQLANSLAAVGGAIPGGRPVARIDIPRIGLDQIVVEGTTADDLRKGPGHLPVSPLPGQIGNSVIVAHANAYGGPFGDLGSLRPGDRISLLTGDGPSTYVVTGHRLISADNTAPFEATPQNRLTLVTSSGLFATSRYVVTASLSGKPYKAPDGRPKILAGSQTGFAGGGGATLALFIWVEVAALAAAATLLCYRRLNRWSSYLITTPILLAVLWLLYATLGRLLPATL